MAVMPDADLDKVVVPVTDKVADDLIERLKPQFRALTVGTGTDKNAEMRPLVRHIENKILVPAPFSPIGGNPASGACTASYRGNRRLRIQLGWPTFRPRLLRRYR